MQTLIDDLRALARITTRGKPLQPVDCQETLDAALTNLAAEIKQGGAKISHGTLPTVQADPTQLMQLFQNLIGNAIKYCTGRPPQIHVSVKAHGGDWVLAVRDNGIGIATQDIPRIFRIFQRLHPDEEEYAGTGIGLALCKKIVERHGGRIWVESELGQGSTFYCTLPRTEPHAA